MVLRFCLLLLLLAAAWGYDFNATTYTAQSANAYTWSASFPQSCTCMQNAVSVSSCNLFQCSCACDLTAGVCDYGCCCDPDCSAAQQARFASISSCPQSSSSSKVPLCYSSVELYKINPKLPLSGQPTAEAAVAGALCISKYNYADKTEFFTNTVVQDSSIFQTSAGKKSYTFGDAAATTATLDSTFDKGDKIAAFSKNPTATTTLSPYEAGYMALPGPDFAGLCNDNNFVSFENPVPPRKCIRKIVDLVAGGTCGPSGTLSVSKIANQYISTTASASASTGSTTTSSAVVKVSIVSVIFEDITTGDRADKTSSFLTNNCDTGLLSVIGNTAPCGAFATVALTSADGVCMNAVKSVKYVVTHSGDATSAITNVAAFIVITNVPSDLTAWGAATTWKLAKDGFEQIFSVEFNGIFTGTALSNNGGNIVRRARSGNPGYIMGKPVLYGTLSSSVINELVAGLSVPSPLLDYTRVTSTSTTTYPFSGGEGACPTSTATTVGQTPIQFGYDMATGCTFSVTRPQFQTLCTATGSTTYTDASGFPLFFNFVNGYVGSLGNADPLDKSQWIAINKLASAPTRVYSEATGLCTGMPTGLAYKFLVATVGEKSFPQNKIISAQVEVIYSNLVFRLPIGDTTSTQSFPLSVTVSFINSNEKQITGYAPPAPPVLFKVPYDVFFPFYMSNAASPSTSASSSLGLIAPLACSLLLIFGIGTRM